MRLDTHHHYRGHGERRFHRPRQALGFGYYAYDLAPSVSPALPRTESATPESEAPSECEKVRQATWKVLRTCAGILFFVVWLYSAVQNWIKWQVFINH